MTLRRVRLAIVSLLVLSWSITIVEGSDGPTNPQPGPIRAILVEASRVSPDLLKLWKGKGANSVVVPLDEATPRLRWSELASTTSSQGLALYPWIEVGRNPAMADAHPDWMASTGGHHDDWRKRFPQAPVAKPGEVVKAWPWVPIGYSAAFEAHRHRLDTLLADLPGPWVGVFLNDIQAGPSSCGCGNDQCRWALDYGSPSTAEKAPAGPAARLVAGLRKSHPGKAIVPVWVTECERIDLPRVERSTGFCGAVECAKTSCWPNYARDWNPLVEASDGPLAVGLWSGAFRRDPAWYETGLSLFRRPPGGRAIETNRSVAVLQGWGLTDAELAAMVDSAGRDGGGWVVAIDRVEQGWEPRVVKVAR